MAKKTTSKAKVKIKPKKETPLQYMKRMKVNILPEDYLNDNEKKIFTRIIDKPIRSWRMSLEEFIKMHEGKEIYVYPFSKERVCWEFQGIEYIRGYAE